MNGECRIEQVGSAASSTGGTLTRDLAFSEPGLRKVFDAQIKAGLLPASRTFDVTRYVASDYLKRARATVVKD